MRLTNMDITGFLARYSGTFTLDYYSEDFDIFIRRPFFRTNVVSFEEWFADNYEDFPIDVDAGVSTPIPYYMHKIDGGISFYVRCMVPGGSWKYYKVTLTYVELTMHTPHVTSRWSPSTGLVMRTPYTLFRMGNTMKYIDSICIVAKSIEEPKFDPEMASMYKQPKHQKL